MTQHDAAHHHQHQHTPGEACGCGTGRRTFLTGASALAAAALLPSVGLGQAVAPAAAPFRIDVHHHPYFPAYLDAVAKIRPVTPSLRDWTPQKSIDDMDQAGVRTAMLSIASPGIWFVDGPTSQNIARIANDEMAKLQASRPGRYGIFAALPMLDTDLTLKEIAYAYDTLKVDGVAMFTSYGDKWLGNPSFAPIFDELNRRKAIVYTHPPTALACCGGKVTGVPDAIVEYGADTARSIAELAFGGATARWPSIRFIFSHAGGVAPYVIERFDFAARDPKVAANLPPDGIRGALRTFYYDTAQSSNPSAMAALGKMVDGSHILFGTDYPFRTSAEHVQNLARCGFGKAALQAIERGNAVKLIPRLKA